MTLEIVFLRRNMLHTHSPLAGFQLQNFVYEQKGIAMRNDFLNLFLIQHTILL